MAIIPSGCYKRVEQQMKRNPSQNVLRGVLCGVTGNRTRDTRIFSPLLYQLSYDTVLLCRCSNGIAKVDIFSDFANFHNVFFEISNFLRIT